MSRPYIVNYVCSGNICRSPIGEVTLRAMLEEAGLADRVEVISSGTGGWHVGDPADPRTVEILEKYGYNGAEHRASEFDQRSFDDYDLILAADYGHERALKRHAKTDENRAKIRLARSFDEEAVTNGDLEIPDPYLGQWEDFELVMEQVLAANKGIVEHIRSELGA